MTGLIMFGLVAFAIGALLLMTRNATLLFSVEVRKGRVVKLKGRAPKGLIRDLSDVLSVRPGETVVLRVRSEGERARFEAKGDITEGETQRIRNVLGSWPVAKIRSAPYRQFERDKE